MYISLQTQEDDQETSSNDPQLTPTQPTSNTSENDPDWDELSSTENCQSIKSFLLTREEFQSANETLSTSLDEIHEGFKAEIDSILQVAVDIHNYQDSACGELEDDIKLHIIQNSKRREKLQQSLEESAKQAQGVFANLLSRLAQKL